MSAEILRRAAALMRERAEARTRLPHGARRCDRGDHPDSAHGHYGYGGRYSCSDFRSPLLSESNMGSRTVYAKPEKSPDAFLLAVADLLDRAAEHHRSESVDELYVFDCDECPEGDCAGHIRDCCWGCVAQVEDGQAGRVFYPCGEMTAALAVARAFLGEQA